MYFYCLPQDGIRKSYLCPCVKRMYIATEAERSRVLKCLRPTIYLCILDSLGELVLHRATSNEEPMRLLEKHLQEVHDDRDIEAET